MREGARTLAGVHDRVFPANLRRHRALCVAALAILPMLVSCRSKANEGGGLVDPDSVPVELRDEWQALVDAQQGDKSSTSVAQAADALLAEPDAPVELHVQALQAKAERAYLLGDDSEAITQSDAALAKLGELGDSATNDPKHEALSKAVHRTLALALVRGGDPVRALDELLWLEQAQAMPSDELRGARAIAYDRAGEQEKALETFVAWREVLGNDSPEAGYAEERIAALVVGLDRVTLERLATQAPGPDAADCLRATLGIDPGDQAPAWVLGCRPLPARIGILLPRSGKLAALADAQLAAAVAAVTVLGRERPVAVLWHDSGSTPETSRKAADRMVADGAEVIIGPVGATNVRAAIEVAGQDRFLLPGEGMAQARGVAPTLEQRAHALLERAATQSGPIVVLVPTNSYGERVRKALEAHAKKLGKSLKFFDYSPSTTSFGEVLKSALGSLGKGGAVIIPDALSRTELIVRQIRRSGFRVAGGVDTQGTELMVLSTAEGLAPDQLGKGHESLEGVVVAPVAWPDKRSREFEVEYRRQQGSSPDDQALLVWRALEAAWSGAAVTHSPNAELLSVQGGQVVSLTTP